ncbi:YaaL family protein [Halalkalibacter nanhaiisediminis]|uniref:Uncharacterized protein DUF2508 n=1 Tax=Halalkalibacter nanhaiisediminis TaxID=688079 RepID=A0A562Q817_9BACI|nr:YaaL family protein [Halalkalibacter nanhaiisediminis]TWI52858.1 uncharacterized protein DUF2508 [Halalkalibacter nanhaiisediminis]
MLFRKRQKLRKLENSQLLMQIEGHKHRLDSQKNLIAHSVDPSDDVLQRTNITEALYSFLLREARQRKATKNEL